MNKFLSGIGLAGLVVAALNAAMAKEVRVAAGSLPVAAEVDVVVVGGTSGGVEAAAEAARNGAKVFLAAERPYLGEDICGTYRLWLEPGEMAQTELSRAVFAASKLAVVDERTSFAALPMKYVASGASSAKHKDSPDSPKLTDGRFGEAAKESVQFDNDVTIVADLGAVKPISAVHVLAYQRGSEFAVGKVEIAVSDDKTTWQPLGVITNDKVGAFDADEAAFPLSLKASAKTRYVRFAIHKAESVGRLLIGELVVEGEGVETPPLAAKQDLTIKLVAPMQVKRTLDEALLKTGVQFLNGSFVSELLRDADGKLAGVVIANRSGRLAIIAKTIIDATERSVVARMAGAEFSAYPGGVQKFERVTVGGAAREGDHMRLKKRDTALAAKSGKGTLLPVFQYELEIPMADGGIGSFAEAEQLARDWTWSAESLDGSETLFQVPPDSMTGAAKNDGAWPGADKIDTGCFAPKGIERLLVLGGCASVSREAAAQLTRPVNSMAVGLRLGKIAAERAAKIAALKGVRVAGSAPKDAVAGDARSVSSDSLPRDHSKTIPEEEHSLPVIGEYDVVVVGGGTGGAGAGIGAARQNAKTLTVEYLHGLGGVGTMGYISSYYHGNRVGFTHEVDLGVAALSPTPQANITAWNPEHKIEWWRSALRKAHGDLWYGSFGSGAVVENNRVTGVIVHTAHGRGVVLAKTVIDSTGNADIAAAAGATCRYTGGDDLAVQGTGLPRRELGQRGLNTDYTYVDETDSYDIWRVLVMAKQKYKDAYDLGQLVDSRERRSIVGDFTMSPMDQWFGRRYADTIVISRSNFDSHGYIVHPLYMLRPPEKQDFDVYIPWRCLLPKGLDRIIVTGLGISVNRDASPLVRMQADIQNQGYASGFAAAHIGQKNCTTRDYDLTELQKHLVEIGNLPENIFNAKDIFPLPDKWISDAVKSVVDDYNDVEVLLADFERAGPLLRDAYSKEEDAPSKLIYAHVLGMVGDATGAATLAKEVAGKAWDSGWRLKSMGQFGASISPLDSLMIALGRTRSPLAIKPLVEKAGQLRETSEFSHFRSIAIALEATGDKAAAKPLADLLKMPGIMGHAVTNITAAIQNIPASTTDETARTKMLTELYLARALYRCGDQDGLGEKILREYAQDLHGHYVRHAQAILKNPPGGSSAGSGK